MHGVECWLRAAEPWIRLEVWMLAAGWGVGVRFKLQGRVFRPRLLITQGDAHLQRDNQHPVG